MSLEVLPTNAMKSNLAAHIREVTTDPRRRVFVGAHRRAEAVLLSTYSELPETQLHALSRLAGRALGYELSEARRTGSTPRSVGECRQILATLAERQRRDDCLMITAEAASVLVNEADAPVVQVVQEIGTLIGNSVEPYLSWTDLEHDAERMARRASGGEVGKGVEEQ